MGTATLKAGDAVVDFACGMTGRILSAERSDVGTQLFTSYNE